MATAAAPAKRATCPRRDENGLTDIDRDGSTILPHLLPQDMVERANAYIDERCARCPPPCPTPATSHLTRRKSAGSCTSRASPAAGSSAPTSTTSA